MLAGPQGLEPQTSVPKTGVIPFHQGPTLAVPRGIEPLFHGWKPCVLTDRRRDHVAEHTGIEPVIFAVTGRRVNRYTNAPWLVEDTGLEPATSWMQIRRSPRWANPPWSCDTKNTKFAFITKKLVESFRMRFLVPLHGFEPRTYWLQISCSTGWAKAASQ